VWIPFFSLRFYTYFFAGLGATGLMLTYLTDASASLTLILSLCTALFCGLSVWLTMKLVRRSESTSTATESDLLGKEGTVLVAIHGRNPGRIRCTVRGDIIDYLAYSEEDTPILPGDSVVVVALENGRAQVIAREAIFGGDVLPTRTS
jgi:membrane protein implicated in regulation of membrane protease activity